MLITDTYTHRDQLLKIWFSDSGDLKVCKSIKISIVKFWFSPPYMSKQSKKCDVISIDLFYLDTEHASLNVSFTFWNTQ